MTRFKLFIPLIIFMLVGAFFYSTMGRISEGDYDPQALPSALLNKPLPHFALPKLENDQHLVQPKDLLGEIALINVWATWCPSCHIEHPYLNHLAKKLDVVIYGVNYKDENKEALRWLKNKGNPYRFNIVDAQGKLGLDLGVTGAPETYVIDHRGFVRMRHQGPMSGAVWTQKFLPLIERLQQEQAAHSQQEPSKG
ncbi:DsbE family thiol:disulfide interchange protein [Dasania sp. GY-MA-18]|uniref:DsbE family thiol:disulfide interchange protein n=1 Tax=Dasania phycosphaerae TaxID=2950436 RepID=A0A9J6RJH6_9GAMM|nr:MULTISPECIES: DsbE family thiol:disulfide interchange protein [Dasania]MCR8921697.1 DsbE family thiol:disulfide interchange protein [Dasania sp. GY-MA-18]MCZ0864125.1 DsbE family thiol:disulfide interchange protein [Dasania phycosphaerae]MCZ0867853.1 DsbE family thiol:disulfide interchange protein [Dasania phycosphaerae]